MGGNKYCFQDKSCDDELGLWFYVSTGIGSGLVLGILISGYVIQSWWGMLWGIIIMVGVALSLRFLILRIG